MVTSGRKPQATPNVLQLLPNVLQLPPNVPNSPPTSPTHHQRPQLTPNVPNSPPTSPTPAQRPQLPLNVPSSRPTSPAHAPVLDAASPAAGWLRAPPPRAMRGRNRNHPSRGAKEEGKGRA